MATLLSYALSNVSDVKESLNIASSNHTYDNLIIRKINQATMQIEAYCDRRFASTVYTNEEYDATNSTQLILKQRPVISLTSLQSRDTDQNSNDWSTVDTEFYFTDTTAGVIDLLFNASGGWNKYRVTYTAGYTTIPDDLAEACATLAGYLANNSPADLLLKSKQEGARKIEYAQQSSNNGSPFQVFNLLGIDGILNGYANYPVLADK